MKTNILTIAAGLISLAAGSAAAGDWVTAPSYYTHDPQTGQRVQQYTPIGPFYTYPRGDFKRSGYHHTRSSIQVGGSADHYHLVEEWGRAVRPYGEWRFPYRPYAVPFHLWSSPFGFGPGFTGGGFHPGFFGGHPFRGGFPGDFDKDPKDKHDARKHLGYPGLFGLPPHRDGNYAPYRTLDPFERQKLLPSDPPPIFGAPGTP